MTAVEAAVLLAIGSGPRASRAVVEDVARTQGVNVGCAWAALGVLVARRDVSVDSRGPVGLVKRV